MSFDFDDISVLSGNYIEYRVKNLSFSLSHAVIMIDESSYNYVY